MKGLLHPGRLSCLVSTCPARHPPGRLVQPTRPPQVESVRTHLGYIPFEGRVGKKLSNTELFLHELKRANIQPVKKVTYTFDPMRQDFQSIRNFMYFWNRPKVLDTNPKIVIKTEIVDDRQEPCIKFNLQDGRDLEIRTGNLTELEIACVVNHYLLPLVEAEKTAVATKGGKAAAASGSSKGGGKKKR